VREVAGLRQRARHALLAIAQQRIQIANQRLDLGWILAFETALPPFTNINQPGTQFVERRQPAPDLAKPHNQTHHRGDGDRPHKVEKKPWKIPGACGANSM